MKAGCRMPRGRRPTERQPLPLRLQRPPASNCLPPPPSFLMYAHAVFAVCCQDAAKSSSSLLHAGVQTVCCRARQGVRVLFVVCCVRRLSARCWSGQATQMCARHVRPRKTPDAGRLPVREQALEHHRQETGVDLHVRIGMAWGVAISGVVGALQPRFCAAGPVLLEADALEKSGSAFLSCPPLLHACVYVSSRLVCSLHLSLADNVRGQ